MAKQSPNRERRDEDNQQPPRAHTLDSDYDDIELIDGAEEELAQMEAHEGRRDDKYTSGGDDLNPGVDLDVDHNGPKDLERD
ncbi:MAG: hypothetical protein SF029_04900 [bacterium]|nr:hypothetical protein [bacterium]